MSEKEHNGPQNGPDPGTGPSGARPFPGAADSPAGPLPFPPSANPYQPSAPPPHAYGQGPAGPNPWAQQGPAGTNPWAQPSPWNQPYPPPSGSLPPSGYLPPPKPGIIPLRPLGLGEILDGAFRSCRRSVGATFGSSLLIQAVIAIVALVLGLIFADSIIEPPTAFASTGEEMRYVFGVLSLVSWLALGSAAGGLLIQGLLVVSTARAVLDLKTGFGQAWRILRPRLLPLAGLVLLMVAAPLAAITLLVLLFALLVALLDGAGIVITVLGSLASLAAFVWVAVKLAVAPAAIVLEGTGVFRSLARAWQVTRMNWWRVFGIVLLTGLIASVLQQVMNVPFSLIVGLSFGASQDPAVAVAGGVVAVAGTLLVSGMAYAFQAAVTSLLYVDLRMRREGFDVALMREQENPRMQDPDFLPGRIAPVLPGGSHPGPGTL